MVRIIIFIVFKIECLTFKTESMKTSDFYLNGHEGNTINDRMNSFHVDTANNHQENGYQVEISYQCKIKCEGDKVYHKPGYCPDCNMKLVSLNKDHNQH